MFTLSTLSFSQLKNAEHVSYFNNVVMAMQKIGIEELGLTTEQFEQFKKAVDAEQDIVLRSQGSMYTADMEAIDGERDQLFRMIHHKLEAIRYVPEKSPLHPLKATLEKYILNKYDTDLVLLPYHEESAHLSGFDLDMHTHFTDEDLQAIGVAEDLPLLKVTNIRFSEMYNERATERSGTDLALSKILRGETESQYAFVKLYAEFTANSVPETEKGIACHNLIGVVNEILKDARQRLNQRQGHASGSDSSADDLGSDVSPIPYPKA